MFVCDENPVAHFVLFSDLRRMTVCDENPVAQLVFFLILHGSDQSKHVKIWLSLSHQHGTVPTTSTFMSIAFHVPVRWNRFDQGTSDGSGCKSS
jgi:hypothetical protein